MGTRCLFWGHLLVYAGASKGSPSFVSRMLTCTRLIPRFCPNAHHHGSLPQQLGVVWDLLLKTDPEGPTLIFHAACPHDWSVPDELLSACACSTLYPRKPKRSVRAYFTEVL